MGTLGPNNGRTFVSDNTVGTVAITNPANAASSDDSYATATLIVGQISEYLKATNFNFSIPLDAAIDGILLEVERSATAANAVSDNAVRIVKGGTIGSTDRSAGGNWPSSDAYQSYGSATDKWGETWTPANINASNFGVAISVIASLASTAQIDHIRITVYYTGSNRPGALAGRFKTGASGTVGDGT